VPQVMDSTWTPCLACSTVNLLLFLWYGTSLPLGTIYVFYCICTVVYSE
jgi:hypothetical protein